MSPAVVEFLSPASAAKKLQSNSLGSRNSSEGRIPAFPSLSRFNLHGGRDSLPAMERLNPGHGVSSRGSAAFPPPPFPSASKMAAPNRRLSRPRLVKHRKHSASYQGRPVGAAQDDDGGSPGFSTFQTDIPVVVLDRLDHSGAESVQDQVASDAYGYSSSGAAFVFGAGSSCLNSASGKNGKTCSKDNGATGMGFFSVGSEMEKASGLHYNSSGKPSTQLLNNAESSKSGGAELDSGAGCLSDSNARSVETRMPIGGFAWSANVDNVYVSGNSAGETFNSPQHSSLGCVDGPFSKLNLYTSVDGSYGNMDSNIFEFKSEEKQCAHSSKNKISLSNEFLCGEKPDNCNKADQQNSDKCNKAELGAHAFHSFAKTMDNSNQSSCVWFNDNSFSKLPEELCKLRLESSGNDEHVNVNPCISFVGDGVKKSTNASISVPFGSIDGSFSSLDDKIKKHNIWNSFDEGHKDADFTISACGSRVKKGARSSQVCSLRVDEGPLSKLERERKVLQASSKDIDSDGVFIFGSGVKKSTNSTKLSSHSLNPISSAFVFQANKEKITSIRTDKHKLQEETGELEVNSSVAFQDRSNVIADFKSPSFVFENGANCNVSSSHASKMSSTASCDSIPLTSQNERRTFNSESFSSNVNLDKIKESFLPQEEVIDRVFFGGPNSLSCSIGDSAVHVENNDSKMGVSTKGVDWASPQANLVVDASGSFGTTLQSGKHDHGPRVCGTETEMFSSPQHQFHFSGAHFNFGSMNAGLEQRMEFRSQKQDTSSLTKESLFSEPCKNMMFTAKKGDSKCVLTKKKRGKCRRSTQIQSGIAKQLQSVDAADGNSPMEYSPFQETLVYKQCARESSVSSDASSHLDSAYTPNNSQMSANVGVKEKEFVSPTEYFDANDCLSENATVLHGSRTPANNYTCESYLVDEMTSELRNVCLAAEDEDAGLGIETCTSARESESFSLGLSNNTYSTGGENMGDSNFIFAGRSSGQDRLSSLKRGHRRKSRVKGDKGAHPLPSSASYMFQFQSPAPAGSAQVLNSSCDDQGTGKVDKGKANQEFTNQEGCEKWRLRGNKAYRDGDLSKAEDYYSRGVNTFPMEEVSENCSRALMLCYSNRAATRMSLGRPIAALGDCKMAITIDPTFLRARVRAGNIHLSLGEPAAAQQHFNKCLELDSNTRSDPKLSSDAADGLEKAQKLNGLLDQSAACLARRTSCDAAKCLEIISEALSISPYSDSLLEMKAETLLMLQDYHGAIQMCEPALELAENIAVSYERLWRWHIISRSYFHLGKLEEACELIQKLDKMKPVVDKYGSGSVESYTSFSVTVRELVRLKAAGNKAFQAGRHLEAVEHYTGAVTLSSESRPFAAICFCNRAAAYQALGKVADAIADCSLAIALDPSYKKAISRRATLLEMIRDYGQSASDLSKLVSLLENSSDDKNASRSEGVSIGSTNNLNQARMRLAIAENEARKGSSLDLYMILGIDKSSSTVDVRKAYRKAALRHHPDKAFQFVAHSEYGDGVWREVADEVHTNADRLFKMISEAYAILLDPSKRQQYDVEEELRTMKKGRDDRGSPMTPSGSYNFQKERGVDGFRRSSYEARRRQYY